MTEHEFEDPAEPSVSRRGLVTAMAAGAAASGALALPARAQVVETATECGHYIVEEMPDHVYERFVAFFKA